MLWVGVGGRGGATYVLKSGLDHSDAVGQTIGIHQFTCHDRHVASLHCIDLGSGEKAMEEQIAENRGIRRLSFLRLLRLQNWVKFTWRAPAWTAKKERMPEPAPTSNTT